MFYDTPTWLISVCLLLVISVANEIGFRLGVRDSESETDLSRTAATALKGTIFGLVALLLGFSFSATTSRYDLRQRLVLDQANAVGTCYLRAGLLEDSSRDQIRVELRRYVRAHLDYFAAGGNRLAMSRVGVEIDRILTTLWSAVEEANRKSPDAVRNSLIVSAANEVIDLSSTRNWAGRIHLPYPVLVLLLASTLISGLLLGHSSGESNQRHIRLWFATNLILSLIMYVILDFDRPHRGLIRVDQTPLVELETTISETPQAR